MANATSPTQAFAFYDSDADLSKQTLHVIQTGLIIGAVLSALFGVLILSLPLISLAIVAALVGLFFLIRGLVRLVVGIFAPGLSTGGRILSIILGVLLIAVGVFALKNPGESLALLGILIGLSWIIDGIASLVESGSAPSRGFAIAGGIISIVAGIVVLSVPITSVAVLVWITGIFLLVFAVAQIVGAFVAGSAARKLSA
jgi:uncharacterized membrane protein HdeD (DUF308 family)